MADQDPNPTIASSTGTGGGKGPGGQHVGWKGIVLMSVYFVFITSLCLSGLVALWPVPTPSRTPPPGETITTGIREEGTEPNAKPMPKGQGLPHASDREPSKVKLLGVTFEVWDEVRLLLIVILCGALGSLVHGIRSFYWYVGNRELIWSWIGKYVIQPLAVRPSPLCSTLSCVEASSRLKQASNRQALLDLLRSLQLLDCFRSRRFSSSRSSPRRC